MPLRRLSRRHTLHRYRLHGVSSRDWVIQLWLVKYWRAQDYDTLAFKTSYIKLLRSAMQVGPPGSLWVLARYFTIKPFCEHNATVFHPLLSRSNDMGRSKSVGMYIPITRSNATPSSSCKDHEASKHNTSAQLFLCNPSEAFSSRNSRPAAHSAR